MGQACTIEQVGGATQKFGFGDGHHNSTSSSSAPPSWKLQKGAHQDGLMGSSSQASTVPGASVPSQAGSPALRFSAFAVARVRPVPGRSQKGANRGPTGVEEVANGGMKSSSSIASRWNEWYSSEVELGRGISATVFQARSSAGDIFTCCSSSELANMQVPGPCDATCNNAGLGGFFPVLSRNRRVAIKKFKKTSRQSFNMELTALMRVGVHPNVVRLLESFPTGRPKGQEEHLVYEFCDGLSLSDAVRTFKDQQKTLPTLLVARLFRQLLLAVRHIGRCGIEHQDIKPENILLFNVCLPAKVAQLKLGDFGWATVGPWREHHELPKAGIGSLWYAPPELNPPPLPRGGSPQASEKETSSSKSKGKRFEVAVGIPVYGAPQAPPTPKSLAESEYPTPAEEPRLLRDLQQSLQDSNTGVPSPPDKAPSLSSRGLPGYAPTATPPHSIHFAATGLTPTPSFGPPSVGFGPPSPQFQDSSADDAYNRNHTQVTRKPVLEQKPSQPVGRSDMWSCGVVLYSLLVGRNPFHAALKVQKHGQEALEAEVVRCVAVAKFDTANKNWQGLGTDARDLISQTLRVPPVMRISPTEALNHPWLTTALEKDLQKEQKERPGRVRGRQLAMMKWQQLDGFQRLSWSAVARAVAEPELAPDVLKAASSGLPEPANEEEAQSAYLFHLALELVNAQPGHWLRFPGAWPEIVRLAFCYLDLNGDGCLDPEDLVAHLACDREEAYQEAIDWLARWGTQDGSRRTDASPQLSSSREMHLEMGEGCITPVEMQQALFAAVLQDDHNYNYSNANRASPCCRSSC